ncbi:MAG: hypothetical protein NT105_16115 [Verrucomicrobia bacterium]|nr:hypothetical protein [Verrucomicrobiota bacterium]
MSSRSDPLGSSHADFLAKQDLLKANMDRPEVAALNITTTEKAAITQDNTNLHTTTDAKATAEAVSQEATKEMNNAFALAQKNYRTMRKNLMSRPGYTPAIGELLGIEAPESNGDFAAAAVIDRPTGKATAMPGGQVDFKVTMNGNEEVDAYSKRGTETEFTWLGRFSRSRWSDTRAPLEPGKPEVREYQLRYRNHDQPTGQLSDVIIVTCLP